MMLRKKKILSSVMSTILVLTTTSCSASTEQEASRSVRSSSIDAYSETSESVETSSLESETTYAWAGEEKDKPQEFGFELTFSDDLKVFDYGQKTVNVYRAKFADYIEFSEPFFSEWIKHSGELGYLVNWSIGGSFDYAPVLKNWEDLQNYDGIDVEFLEFQCSDYDAVRRNIQNVDMVTLKEIDNGEELAKKCGIDTNSPILCWEYNVVDFPVEDAVKSFYDVQVDADLFSMSTVKYAQVRAQYIDGIPVCGEWDNFNECTYDWPGLIEPSRRAATCNLFFPSYLLVNPSDTVRFDIATQRYITREVIKADLPVIAPEECLNGIEDTIKYQPSAVRNSKDIFEAWGMNIEVYCMELTYLALDPNPLYSSESEESHISHVLYLVPAWKVYYICTDPNSNAIGHGTLVVNAATGESLFSSTIPQGTNLELYPDLYKEG